MFTLGNKEIVINSPDKFKTEINTVDGTDELSIQGFGSFEENQVLDVVGQRFIAPRVGGLEITVPFADAIGIEAGEKLSPVVVHIRVNTSRHSSEWAIDFIKRGRPFIFEVLVDGGDSDAVIAAKLVQVFEDYEAVFNIADGLPFTWDIDAEVITLTLKDSYLSIQDRVVFLPHGKTYGLQATTTPLIAISTFGINSITDTVLNVTSSAGIVVGDTIGQFDDPDYHTYIVTDITDTTHVTIAAPGLSVATTGADSLLLKSVSIEPTFDGKYLEENVRKSTPRTSDSYGISPNEKPIITGDYTTVTFKVKDEDGGINLGWKKHAILGNTRGEVGGTREFTFTMYFLEGTTLLDDGTGNKVWDIVDFLINAPNATSTLFVQDGTTVATATEFVTST